MSNYRTHEPQRPDGPLCNGKITHVTGARAWSEAAKVNRKRRGRSKDNEQPVQVYRCPTCGLYHLGRR